MFGVPLTILWLIAMVVFVVVEGATATALVSVWFAIGAFAAMLTSLFTSSLLVQIAVFLVVSCIAFALVRPLAKKYLTPNLHPTNADRLIGTEGVVTLRIDNLAAVGQIRLKGQIWTARSESDDVPIDEGTRVIVLRIEGVKVIVRAAEQPQP